MLLWSIPTSTWPKTVMEPCWNLAWQRCPILKKKSYFRNASYVIPWPFDRIKVPRYSWHMCRYIKKKKNPLFKCSPRRLSEIFALLHVVLESGLKHQCTIFYHVRIFLYILEERCPFRYAVSFQTCSPPPKSNNIVMSSFGFYMTWSGSKDHIKRRNFSVRS